MGVFMAGDLGLNYIYEFVVVVWGSICHVEQYVANLGLREYPDDRLSLTRTGEADSGEGGFAFFLFPFYSRKIDTLINLVVSRSPKKQEPPH